MIGSGVHAEVEELKAELAAYKRAKQENDERFMCERDEARAERDAAIKRAKEAEKDAAEWRRQLIGRGESARDLRAENEKLRGELAARTEEVRVQHSDAEDFRRMANDARRELATIAEKTAREQRDSDIRQYHKDVPRSDWPLVTDAPSKPEPLELTARRLGTVPSNPAPPPSESPAETRCKHGHYCTGGEHGEG